MAGKPKKPELRKNYVLRIRMTEGERAAVEETARETGMEVSTWARVQLLALARKARSRQAGGRGG